MSRSRNALRALSLKSATVLAGLLVFAGVPQLQTAAAETGCSAAERDAYFDAIEARIYENWRIPHTNRTLSCKVLIKQDFRGEVRDVGIALCGARFSSTSNFPALRREITDAESSLRASAISGVLALTM